MDLCREPPGRFVSVIDKDEYECHKAALKQQISEWGQVRQTAEQNVERLQRELSDLQDAYLVADRPVAIAALGRFRAGVLCRRASSWSRHPSRASSDRSSLRSHGCP